MKTERSLVDKNAEFDSRWSIYWLSWFLTIHNISCSQVSCVYGWGDVEAVDIVCSMNE